MSQLLTSTLGHVWFGGASAIGRLYDGAEHATAPTAEIFSTNNTIAIGGPAISNGTCATIRAAVVVMVVVIVTPLCSCRRDDRVLWHAFRRAVGLGCALDAHHDAMALQRLSERHGHGRAGWRLDQPPGATTRARA